MISGRPSTEQLEKYFKDSRKYFDDIAKHYQEVDREYYDKYIAPFYDSPFGAIGSGTAKKAASAIVFAIAIFIAILGVVVFLLVNQSTDSSDEYKERTTETQSESIEDESDFEYKTNYEKGLYFYNLEKYNKAEKYFKRVKGTDSDYKDALRKIKEIKSIERENMDDGSARQKKLERPG
jgi:tetratricopeptide (TPR) repeat protein